MVARANAANQGHKLGSAADIQMRLKENLSRQVVEKLRELEEEQKQKIADLNESEYTCGDSAPREFKPEYYKTI
jgi:hypothetical protein